MSPWLSLVLVMCGSPAIGPGAMNSINGSRVIGKCRRTHVLCGSHRPGNRKAITIASPKAIGIEPTLSHSWSSLAHKGKMKTNLITLPSHSNSFRAMTRLIPVLAFYGVISLLAGCASGPAPKTDFVPSGTVTTTQDTRFASGFECPTNRPVVLAMSPSVTTDSTPQSASR
jgi:hypothetical protein